MLQANSPSSAKFLPMYNIYERIQMTGFCLQEFAISGIYVYRTRKILKPGEQFQKGRARRVMRNLIYINVLIIVLDLALLATEYAGLWHVETTFKTGVYSIKLKLEFIILNQLVEISQVSLRSN